MAEFIVFSPLSPHWAGKVERVSVNIAAGSNGCEAKLSSLSKSLWIN
jgi:hypothetical protein